MGYKPEHLPMISGNKYFLRSKDLQFFGISSHQFKTHFSSHNEFVSAILKEYQVVLNESKGGTAKLRGILTESGRYLGKCEVPGCHFNDEFGVEIHHIVPRAAANQVNIDINCEVPGCHFNDEFGVEIHHIVPRAAANQVNIDINCIENLVVLCPNHHRIAEKIDWRHELNLGNCRTWMKAILQFISEKEERSEQDNVY